MPFLVILFLGIVEGLTEFIPVSSTGHLILAGELVKVPEGSETFDIVIQLGAILSVLVVYRARFASVLAGLGRRDPEAIHFTRNVLLGFLPSAVIGAVAYSAIKALLNQPIVVAVALLVGGIAMLVIERMAKRITTESVEAMGWRTALGIGFVQCISMIPGVSRSGATIMGALLLGVERKTAAEYSFFLAIPTMLGATTLALWKARHQLGGDQITDIALGFVISFVVAIVVIRWFLGVVTKRGFAPFAWYRIVVGALALVWLVSR
ncbi:undecaprenyl-diphosphate phosphatase [Sphingomonas montanisoli]|uniref:Undecaprenyl-diphosphatase n=1 Tax=Sphingomonas montanisoli TaxID=2606412 RepID=A0A5D9C7H4_9SPHN|nr:undecaprenyl-diphosphate phosphatase [Sphingomonas montanisoli]TZG27207.1 undecaprenyl-diphosphate phosphatase [Sphingomonas montanisoli]